MKKKIFLLSLFLIVFVGLLSICCTKKNSQTKGSEKTVYSCTMHHEIRKDDKGQCPICGMDLVVVSDINQW